MGECGCLCPSAKLIGKLAITMIKCLEFASVVAGFIAALTLYLSGRGYPNPSWKVRIPVKMNTDSG